MSNELESIWNDRVVVGLCGMYQDVPQGTEDSLEKVQSHVLMKDIPNIKQFWCPHAYKSA